MSAEQKAYDDKMAEDWKNNPENPTGGKTQKEFDDKKAKDWANNPDNPTGGRTQKQYDDKLADDWKHNPDNPFANSKPSGGNGRLVGQSATGGSRSNSSSSGSSVPQIAPASHATPSTGSLPALSPGYQIEYLTPGGRTTMLSAAKANEVIAAVNAFLGVKIIANINPDATDQNPQGNIVISNQKVVIELLLPNYQAPPAQPSAGGAAGEGTFTSMQSDYIVVSIAGVNTPVAKPPQIRCSITSQTLNPGGMQTYAFPATTAGGSSIQWGVRKVTSTTPNEWDILCPQYVAGMVIAYDSGETGVVTVGSDGTGLPAGTEITLIERSPVMWQRLDNQAI